MGLFLGDPEEMTVEQRLAEVAAILAAGYRVFTEKRLDCSDALLPLCVDGPRESAPVEVQQ